MYVRERQREREQRKGEGWRKRKSGSGLFFIFFSFALIFIYLVQDVPAGRGADVADVQGSTVGQLENRRHVLVE